MTEKKLVSVVIAIKDWEPERLALALRSHRESSIGDKVEVIVSDYGSENSASTKSICSDYGCIYKYTDAEIWSRSRGLNAGLSLATCKYMVTTDADIVFAPKTLEATVEFLEEHPSAIVLAQCHNLSEEFALDKDMELPWPEIYEDALLRPRWGMGGLCAFDQDTYTAVRGFEERMTVWGAEDNDFVKRCRQAERFVHWIQGNDIGIYHVWHPPFLQTDPNAEIVFKENKKLLNEELTTARNYLNSTCFSTDRPLVSVNIATHNRAHFIGDAIQSVLNQTVTDFEILIYDDGSIDNTEEVVGSFDDSRIRYYRNEDNNGVAYARNRMLMESRGVYTCVHDDDDIMLPNRLELQLNAMNKGFVGTYGGWIDFDAKTAELMKRPGKEPFGVPAIAFVGSSLLHPTLMIETNVMRKLGYETSFRGGSDFNLALRLAFAGYRLNHCGDYLILRRVHGESLTGHSKVKQRTSSHVSISPFLNNIPRSSEIALREKAKSVKQVPISPTYGDQTLLNFLPAKMFDRLVEITASEEKVKNSDVTFFSNSGTRRDYVVQRAGTFSNECEKNNSASQHLRISPMSEPSTCPEEAAQSLKTMMTGACSRINIGSVENMAVVQLNDSSEKRLIESIESHSHLYEVAAHITYYENDYLLVTAQTEALANLVAYSVVEMITVAEPEPVHRVDKVPMLASRFVV